MIGRTFPARARRLFDRASARARRISRTSESGFILLETIIAISLITVIMAAIGAEYVGGVASVSRQRTAQSAAQIANSTLEQVRALRPSDLVAGRGSASVTTQFGQGNAIPSITPWLQQMDPASDANAQATAGANATIPTCAPAPQGTAGPALCTQKPGAVAYTVAQFIGTCWLVASGSTSNCVPAAQKTSSSVSYLRVVVSVSWRDGACSAGCYYVTSTLVNASGDPTFRANQPPLPAPAVAPPGDQNNDLGDAVNLQLGLLSGTGVPGYAWAITSGSLPSGLSLNPSGVISGVVAGPTGARSITVQVTDGYNRTATATFTWTIYNPPTITTPANQTTQISIPVNLQLTTTCGNPPCTYTLNNGPAGLTVSSTGLVTGTPTVAGAKTVTVTVTDAANVSVTSSTFNWTVVPSAAVCSTAVNLANGSFETPSATAGAGYNVHNGTSGLGWTTNDTNGLVEFWANGGNSQSANAGTAITAQSGTQWVEVNGAGMDTLYQDLATTPGQVLQWSLWHRARNATGNVNRQDSIQVQMGSTTSQSAQVPNGATTATITDNASAWVQYTGVYTVPTGQTTTRFQVAAISTSSGNAGIGNFVDNVAVTGAPCLASLPPAQTSTVGTPITGLQLTASQGSGTYTWSGGSTLPAGLTLSSSGLITGTPTTTGTTSVSLVVTDSTSSYQQLVPFTWSVKAAPTITTPSTQTTSVGAAVSVTVGSTCPNTPCTYALTGQPAGLSINNSGVITGTPTTAGTSSSAKVTVTDASGTAATTSAFTWTIYARPTITSPASQADTLNTALILPISSSCANSPCTYVLTGAPAGLTINAATGAITGTPTATGTSASVNVTMTDAAGASVNTGTFTWVIYARPSVTAPANQSTVNNAAVNLSLTTSCPNAPCAYRLNGGPAGLSISSAGVVTGTVTSPTQVFAGVTITVTDGSGATATSAAFTWTVTTPLVGRWTFDEPSGSTAADSVGSHPATLSGGYGKTGTSVQGANALTLNGTAGTAASTNGPVLNTTTSFTVSAWAKLAATSDYATFVAQSGSNVAGFYLQYNPATNRFRFYKLASDATSSGGAAQSSISAPVLGQWYQLTGVYDSTAATISLFVNGVRQGPPVAAPNGFNATGNFTMGAGNFGGLTNWTNGAIDDVRAYSSALSDSAVAQLAQAQYLPLDDGSGTNASDSSLNNIAGTLSGGTSWTTGIVGPSAVQFNGSNGVVTSSPNPIDTSQSFSVAAWAKADSLSSTGAVISADGSAISSFVLRQDNNRWALAGVSNDSSSPTAVTTVYSSTSVAIGQWYHLVGVYDSVARTLALYVNGVLQGSPVSVPGNFKASGPLLIGRSYYQGNTNFFGGAIDDVHAYRFPLDQTGVTALTTLAPPTPAAPTASTGASSATVSWTAPTGVGGSPMTGYVVTPYLSGVAQTPVSYNSTATSQTLTGLTSGGSYTFSVAAVNANSTSATSALSNTVVVS